MIKTNEFKVKLNTVDKVKRFIKIVSDIDVELDLVVGRYIIDAKSIMGIFSIDISRSVLLRIESDSRKKCDEIREKLKEFIVEE